MSQALKSLVLYKRHTSACSVNESRIPIRNRRFFMDCGCPIWIEGRTPSGDILPRQSTRTSNLKEAEAVRSSLMTKVPSSTIHGPSLAECIEKYLTSRAQELNYRTLYQHKLALGRLQHYLEAQGVLHIQDITVDHLEAFKTAGLPKDMESTSRATTDAKIRCFLRVAFRRGWLKEHLVERVTTVKAVYEEKEPFTDKEVSTILEEALELSGDRRGYAKHRQTFRLLLEVMLETGMRVGDAVGFDPSILQKGETMWIYTFRPHKQKKTDKPRLLEVYITEDLKERILHCEWLSPSRPFWYGLGTDPRRLAAAVYQRMQEIGERAGVVDCRPHRLRDTFAVRKLLAGMNLEDVSRLLGHSSIKITQSYYARWISSRKLRLERIVAETLVNP